LIVRITMYMHCREAKLSQKEKEKTTNQATNDRDEKSERKAKHLQEQADIEHNLQDTTTTKEEGEEYPAGRTAICDQEPTESEARQLWQAVELEASMKLIMLVATYVRNQVRLHNHHVSAAVAERKMEVPTERTTSERMSEGPEIADIAFRNGGSEGFIAIRTEAVTEVTNLRQEEKEAKDENLEMLMQPAKSTTSRSQEDRPELARSAG